MASNSCPLRGRLLRQTTYDLVSFEDKAMEFDQLGMLRPQFGETSREAVVTSRLPLTQSR
jgi:hypothetical protein